MIATPDTPNELQFVDDDIRKEFEGKSHFIGTPSLVQLNRNMSKMIEILISIDAELNEISWNTKK